MKITPVAHDKGVIVLDYGVDYAKIQALQNFFSLFPCVVSLIFSGRKPKDCILAV
jgi:hypothetical protein